MLQVFVAERPELPLPPVVRSGQKPGYVEQKVARFSMTKACSPRLQIPAYLEQEAEFVFQQGSNTA